MSPAECRLGSLVGLNVGDTNLDACTLHSKSKGGSASLTTSGSVSLTTRGGSERVFLNPQLRGLVLRQHLDESATREPVA